MAPAAVPLAIIARLNREIVEILKEPDTIETLENSALSLTRGRQRRCRISDEIVKWRDVIKDTKSNP